MNTPHYERIAYRRGVRFLAIKERADYILANLNLVECIDDVLEIYELIKCIRAIKDTDVFCIEEKHQYDAQKAKLHEIVGRYFVAVTSENFAFYANGLHYEYAEAFWDIMVSSSKTKDIAVSSFKNYLDANPHHLAAVFMQKKIAMQFNNQIYQHLVEHPEGIRLIVSHLLERVRGEKPTLFIKESLAPNKLRHLFESYIKCEHAHINVVRLISVSQNDATIGLDDGIRLLARRRERVLSEKLSKSASALHHSHGVGVSFRDSQSLFEIVTEEGKEVFVYDIKWFIENLDYPTILNNFIHVFGFTDLQCRSSFPQNQNCVSPLADIFTIKGLKTYDATPAFNAMKSIFSLELYMYIEALKQHEVDFENVVKWFFEEYLLDEFSVRGFMYNAASPGTSFLEKCKNISSEIERVLKQYRLYSTYGYIDSELFEMSSEHLLFSNLKSLNGKKYVYVVADSIIWCMNDLFSNSILCYSDDNSLNCFDCFFDAIMEMKRISANLFNHPLQYEPIKRLLDFKAIYLKDGYYYLNEKEVAFLKNIYDKEVLCYNYAPSMQEMIHDMCDEGKIVIEDSLFTRPEQKYLNYILNKNEFSDGFDLRNKYSHGTTSLEESEHLADYLEFMKIMILIMIKINEEFCLREEKR